MFPVYRTPLIWSVDACHLAVCVGAIFAISQMRQEQSEFDRVSRKEPGLKSLEIVNVLRKFPRRYSYKFRLHDGHIPEGKKTLFDV